MAVSLAELFWQALEAEGWLDELIAQEIDADGDETAMADIFRSVSEILHLAPSLPDRVAAAVEDLAGERAAVFLYRAGALFPAYRTSTLIDDLRGRLRLPVTLLYPGRIVGDYGLRFMDKTEPATATGPSLSPGEIVREDQRAVPRKYRTPDRDRDSRRPVRRADRRP